MNLLEEIHSRWADDATLNGLLDSENVYTGRSFDPTPPFCVLTRESQAPEWQANCSGCVDRVGMRFQLFHANYDTGYVIVETIREVYNRANFDLDGGDSVLTMERSGEFEIQEDDGVWRFVLDFQCLVHLIEGC